VARSSRFGSQAGFTLLEVLVATAIMGIAIAGLLGNLTTSVSNAARLVDADRTALLARRKMDELLLQRRLPRMVEFSGPFAPEIAGGHEAGWRARVTPFEFQARPAPGQPMLERIELEVWLMNGRKRRTLQLEAFRTNVLTVEEANAIPQPPEPGVRP
jgi:general secretion pathway protein I